MPETTIVKTEFEAGYIVTIDQSGNRTRYPLSTIITSSDVPTGITYVQVASIKAIANLLVILIRTLIDRQILSEEFGDDLGLDIELSEIIRAIEDMGGSFHKPDLEAADD